MGADFLKAFGDYAAISTFIFSIIGACIAWRTIVEQKKSDRRKAAVDFFLKAEMDGPMLDAFARYKAASAKLAAAFGNKTNLKAFMETPEYHHVRSYLNVDELLAVGVRTGCFDEDVCYHYWSDSLIERFKECEYLIKHLQQQPDGVATYLELTKLNALWSRKIEEYRRKNPPPRVA